jgi:hypothetical protein
MNRMVALLLVAGLTAVGARAPSVEAGPTVIDTLGSPVSGITSQLFNVDRGTKVIRIEHQHTCTFRNQRGQSFSWRFDTFHVPTGFPLSSIAPPEFDAGDTWVYIRPRPQYPSD